MLVNRDLWNSIKDLDLKRFSFGARVVNVFSNLEIKTIKDLEPYARFKNGNFLGFQIPGLGKRSLSEVENAIREVVDHDDVNNFGEENLSLFDDTEVSESDVSLTLAKNFSNLPEVEIKTILHDDVTIRMKNSLERAGYLYLSDLNGKSYREIKNLRSVGGKTFQSFINFIEKFSSYNETRAQVSIVRWIAPSVLFNNYSEKTHEHFKKYFLSESISYETKDFIDQVNGQLSSDSVRTVKRKYVLEQSSMLLRRSKAYDYSNIIDENFTVWDTYRLVIADILSDEKIEGRNRSILQEIEKLILLGKVTYVSGWIDRYDAIEEIQYSGEIDDFNFIVKHLQKMMEESIVNGLIVGQMILKDDLCSKTLQEIGDTVGVSLTRERVRQIKNKLEKKIRYQLKEYHYYQLEILEREFAKSRILNIQDFQQNVYFDDFFKKEMIVRAIFYLMTVGLERNVYKDGDFLLDQLERKVDNLKKYTSTIISNVKESLDLLDHYPSLQEISKDTDLTLTEIKYALFKMNIDHVAGKVLYESPLKTSTFLKKRFYNTKEKILISELAEEYHKSIGGSVEKVRRLISAYVDRAPEIIRLGKNNEYLGNYSAFVSTQMEERIIDICRNLLEKRESGLAGAVLLKRLRSKLDLDEDFNQYTLVDILERNSLFSLGRKAFVSLREHNPKPTMQALVHDYIEENPEATTEKILEESGTREYYSDYTVRAYLGLLKKA